MKSTQVIGKIKPLYCVVWRRLVIIAAEESEQKRRLSRAPNSIDEKVFESRSRSHFEAQGPPPPSDWHEENEEDLTFLQIAVYVLKITAFFEHNSFSVPSLSSSKYLVHKISLNEKNDTLIIKGQQNVNCLICITRSFLVLCCGIFSQLLWPGTYLVILVGDKAIWLW